MAIILDIEAHPFLISFIQHFIEILLLKEKLTRKVAGEIEIGLR
jgi:hypothetical protein